MQGTGVWLLTAQQGSRNLYNLLEFSVLYRQFLESLKVFAGVFLEPVVSIPPSSRTT